MKTIFLIILFFLLSCAKEIKTVQVKERPCALQQVSDGIVITCPNQEPIKIRNGDKGDKGDKGDIGNQGPIGETGPKGNMGDQGPIGESGKDGLTLLFDISQAEDLCPNNGQTISLGYDLDFSESLELAEVTQIAVICNGLDGELGPEGPAGKDAPITSFTPVSIIDPCGNSPNIYNEVFLKLENDTILASFSDNASGKNTRFSILVDGTYQTTDGDNCIFQIEKGEIVYENHRY
jgi:hypothetical protein